jgi:hypothetical protein
MFSRRLAEIATVTVAAGAFGLAAFAGTATASASAVDDQFLKNITAEGITFDSAKGAVQDAQQVCSYFADGETGSTIGADIMGNTDLNAHQTAVFIVEATYAYCPGFAGRVTA